MYIEHDIDLETDTMYKFYIGRVSAISILLDNTVRMDYTIEDPENVDFTIYSNDLMADIDGVNSFLFGTSIEGVHTIKITIYCVVSYVNIAYATIEDYQIGDVVDVNDTDPDDGSDDGFNFFDEFWDNSTSIPAEWAIATVIFVGSITGILVIVLVQQRKNNAVNLDLKER